MPKSDLEEFVKSRPPMFWWFLANVLMIALAITSWIVCLSLFRDPTHPTSYKLMLQVGRLQPLQKFIPVEAPTPQKTSDVLALEAQFEPYSEEDLETLNKEFKRAYLTSYAKTKFLTYVIGDYKILNIRPLTENDFFPSGVVLRAQAIVTPDDLADPISYPLFIEYLLPSSEDITTLHTTGEIIKLEKRAHCAAILNVGQIDYDDRTVPYITVTPLSSKNPKIHPPEAANVAAPLPVFP